MRFTFHEDFLGLLFPKGCCICKRSLFKFEEELCRVCVAALPLTNYHLRPTDNDLKARIVGLTQVNQALSFLRFTKSGMSQQLIHELKYLNNPKLGRVLGKIYGYLLSEHGYSDYWDVVVPVPLHAIRLKKRGYNQSEQFAIGLAEILEIPVSTALKRIKHTETQTNKSRIQRWENVENVFEIESKILADKKVLLVDDVMTTGSTLAACANTLLASGALSVDLAVIAAGGR